MHTCSVLVLVERAAGMSDATSHISHALRVLLPFLVLPAPPRNRCAPSSARCSGVATSRASVSRALGNKNGQGQQWPHSRRAHAHAPQRAPARRAKDFLWTRSPVHARIMGTTAAVARSRATFTTTHAATAVHSSGGSTSLGHYLAVGDEHDVDWPPALSQMVHRGMRNWRISRCRLRMGVVFAWHWKRELWLMAL